MGIVAIYLPCYCTIVLMYVSRETLNLYLRLRYSSTLVIDVNVTS